MTREEFVRFVSSARDRLERHLRAAAAIDPVEGAGQHQRLAAAQDATVAGIKAQEAGYDVLLEKPPAPVIQQLDAMIEAERRTGHFCCVGFQNQSKGTTRALKRLICEGKLGRVLSVQVLAEWVRLDSYYERNAWAGKIMHEGKYCLDGPTCNALAHYLFNALYWSSHQ